MDKKRLLIIIGFLVFAILLGIMMFRLFFGSGPLVPGITTPGTTPATSTPGTFPISGGNSGQGGQTTGQTTGTFPDAGGTTGQTVGGSGLIPTLPIESSEYEVTQVIPDDARSPSIDASGALRYYNNQDGKFYRYDANGNLRALSSQVFYNASEVTWSPVTDDAIIEYPDGSNIHYDFETQRQTTLPKHWEDFSYSTDGAQIAAKSIGLSPTNRWLITSNPDGTSIRNIEPLGENANKVIVDYAPNNQIIAFSRTGDALGADREQVLLVGKNQENFLALEVEGRGFEPNWSPEGDHLLYSVYNAANNFNPELWVVDANGARVGANRSSLGISTWAEKCTFAEESTVYCAVPTDLKRGSGFNPELAATTQDKIVRIDLNSGLQTTLDTNGYYLIDKLFVDEQTNTLYFEDRVQSGIFSIDL
jgi:hypothetical protein